MKIAAYFLQVFRDGGRYRTITGLSTWEGRPLCLPRAQGVDARLVFQRAMVDLHIDVTVTLPGVIESLQVTGRFDVPRG